MNFNTHPLIAISNLINRYENKNLIFTFCKYIDGEKGTTLKREFIEIAGNKINKEWFLKEINNLKEDEEFAITSLVKYNNEKFHMPLIDFKIETWNDKFFIELLDKPNTTFFLFESGSSYHGYLSTLISYNEWMVYLGKLLLLNKHYSEEIVDSLWVGYSLQRGFSTLRLTNSCKPSLPTLIKVIESQFESSQDIDDYSASEKSKDNISSCF